MHYQDELLKQRCKDAGLDIEAITEAFIQEVKVEVPPLLMNILGGGLTYRYNTKKKRKRAQEEMKKGDKKTLGGPIVPFNKRLEIKQAWSDKIRAELPEIRRRERIERAL